MAIINENKVAYGDDLEREGKYILGLVNVQNYCFVNSVLQVKKKGKNMLFMFMKRFIYRLLLLYPVYVLIL